MWDSGKVPGEQSLLIPYDGQPLEAAETYYWSVRVWGPDGKPSAWSPAQRFTMGLPDREDWSGARWIALEEDVDSLIVINGTFDTGPDNPILGNKPFGRNKLPLLRREFTVDKPVRRRRPMSADWASSSCFSTARRRATTSSIRPGPSSIRRCNTFRST